MNGPAREGVHPVPTKEVIREGTIVTSEGLVSSDCVVQEAERLTEQFDLLLESDFLLFRISDEVSTRPPRRLASSDKLSRAWRWGGLRQGS